MASSVSTPTLPGAPGSAKTLRLFDQECLDLLSTVAETATVTQDASVVPSDRPLRNGAAAGSTDAGPVLSCGTCSATFTSPDEMRPHFKSDWHRYNLKRKLADRASISEDAFDELAEVSSIEASDSEGENDHDDDSRGGDAGGTARRMAGSPFMLIPLQGEEGKAVRVYSQVITKGRGDTLGAADVAGKLKDYVQQTPARWTLIMVGAGHFAGTVVDCKTEKAVAHKTFHRYTTRRKQGGAQSSNDGAKGAANSAGAMLRRYNEQALQTEIRELLAEWKPLLETSQLIFIRATPLNRKSLYFDGSPLATLTERIRSFPFTTRRPTLLELMRGFKELTTVRVQKMIKSPAAAAAASRAPAATPRPKVAAQPEQPAAPVLDPEVAKLVDFCRRGKVDLVQAHLAQHPHLDINASFPEALGTSYLHVASAGDQPLVVTHLLSLGADPTTRTEKKGLPAYDMATAKDTRDAFRRFVAGFPDKWDWKEAHVPGALTPEMEQQQKDKDREKKRKQKEKQKAYNAAKKLAEPEEEETQPVASMSKKSAVKGLGKSDREALGMTPERRAAMDREKRALAAEARIRGRMNQCAACGKSLLNVTPFEKFLFRYCSMACVQKHQILHS
ncbi:hypothetical protein HKX48_000600 [Thoreauomyces humboldtii]|nr:hypothetical protein HKX48_000600 [Thoreauomyces humboldtii]